MALAYQARALLAGLAKLGEPSLLEGDPCGHVAIERDVEINAGIGDTAHDNPVVRVNIATVAATPAGVDMLLRLTEGTTPITHAPRVGQLLVHPSDGSFKLDRLYKDNGITRRYIVRPA